MALPTRLSWPRPDLGDAYTLRAATPSDHENWISLLNSDEGFGCWDMERLDREILQWLMHPASAALLFRGQQLIGCAAMCMQELHGRVRPMGMYLILDAGFRGQFKLSLALYRCTLAYAEDAGHDRVFATTFEDRSSALTLYALHDAKPIHTNLYSWIQWRRINKRIAPIVKRLRKRSS